MNKKTVLLVVSIVFLYTITLGRSADFKKLLTINEVEKVTGIQGIQLVPRDPTKGAGGDLNFALKDGTVLLIVLIQDSSMYNAWKKQQGFFHASVSNLGDEAFEGPSIGKYRYILVFCEGKQAFSLSSFFNLKAGGKPFLNQEQLRDIAKIIISRL